MKCAIRYMSRINNSTDMKVVSSELDFLHDDTLGSTN